MYIIFKEKKSKRSHKTVGIKVFRDRRIQIRIRNWSRIRIYPSDWWIRIQEAQKHVDPVDLDPDLDPDPQHWKNVVSDSFKKDIAWTRQPASIEYHNKR